MKKKILNTDKKKESLIKSFKVEDVFYSFLTVTALLVIYAFFDPKSFVTTVNYNYSMFTIYNYLTAFIRNGKILKFIFFPLLIFGFMFLFKLILAKYKKWNVKTGIISLFIAAIITTSLFFAIPAETTLFKGYKSAEMVLDGNTPRWIIETNAEKCTNKLDFFFLPSQDKYTLLAKERIEKVTKELETSTTEHCFVYKEESKGLKECENLYNLSEEQGNIDAKKYYVSFSPTLLINCNTMLKGIFTEEEYKNEICKLTELC